MAEYQQRHRDAKRLPILFLAPFFSLSTLLPKLPPFVNFFDSKAPAQLGHESLITAPVLHPRSCRRTCCHTPGRRMRETFLTYQRLAALCAHFSCASHPLASIADPFKNSELLEQTWKNLNRSLPTHSLRFGGDGSRECVRWFREP